MGALQSRKNKSIRIRALETRTRNVSTLNLSRKHENMIYDGMWSSSSRIVGSSKISICSIENPRYYHIISTIPDQKNEWDDKYNDLEEEERPLSTTTTPAGLTSDDSVLKGWRGFMKKFQWNFKSSRLLSNKINQQEQQQLDPVCDKQIEDKSETEESDSSTTIVEEIEDKEQYTIDIKSMADKSLSNRQIESHIKCTSDKPRWSSNNLIEFCEIFNQI